MNIKNILCIIIYIIVFSWFASVQKSSSMDVEKNEKDLAGDISADEKDDGLPNETVFKLAPEEALILQKALNDAGHLCQRSGVVGKKTVRALKRYQRSKGLPVTGKPDKETLKSLNIYDEIAKRENK